MEKLFLQVSIEQVWKSFMINYKSDEKVEV